MPNRDIIKLATLREFVANTVVRDVFIVGQPGGYVVQVKTGTGVRTLADKGGEPRLFSSIDTARRTLGEAGIEECGLNWKHHEPGRLRPRRLDLSLRMKSRHDAAKKWFREHAQDGDAPVPRPAGPEGAVAGKKRLGRERR